MIKIKIFLFALGAALLAIAGIYGRGVKVGRKAIEEKNKDEFIKIQKETAKIKQAINSLDSERVRNELRDKWTRPD